MEAVRTAWKTALSEPLPVTGSLISDLGSLVLRCTRAANSIVRVPQKRFEIEIPIPAHAIQATCGKALRHEVGLLRTGSKRDLKMNAKRLNR
jgi:hypothetical protein